MSEQQVSNSAKILQSNAKVTEILRQKIQAVSRINIKSTAASCFHREYDKCRVVHKRAH